MKILLVCAGGVSTSILMKKMMNYASQNGIDLLVEAHAVQEFDDVIGEFEAVLVGPQISYKLAELKGKTSKPVAVIDSLDYALGNAEKVINLAKKILG
ncbi:Lichenan-specific phosphotransferase enzyme IIB component [compost metagenome]|uniref:PTS sugar transporter subunit IIB n=1 Tax=Clostridium intestinale TaxID=36845 RepID=UPI000FC35CA5|nr:PTS sugar transporter subunit IIB [Clostridium intestinale]WRY49524.1 PTS sugar transporter subunit IIB [Clostridium intestinale]